MTTITSIDASERRLTVEAVAELFEVDRDTVYAWIESGELKAINVAKRPNAKRKTYRISSEAVESFQQLRTKEKVQPKGNRTKRAPFERHF